MQGSRVGHLIWSLVLTWLHSCSCLRLTAKDTTDNASPPTIRLRNGVAMPMIGMGTWQYEDQKVYGAVKSAIRAGFTLIDTAWDYHNEEAVGQAIRDSGKPREAIFVETKVPGCGVDYSVSTWRCYSDTAMILEANLKLLNMTYVDLVIIHFPPLLSIFTRTCSTVCGEVRDQWRAVEEFYLAGKAKAIGVSNYCPSCFNCLENHTKVYPMVNQVRYHIGMGPDAGGFVSFARKKGVVLQAFSPLGNGFSGQGPDGQILHGELTKRLADKYNKTTVQVALKWLVDSNIPAVTKSSNFLHQKADLDLWSWSFTSDEMKEIDNFELYDSPGWVFCGW